MSNLYSGIKVKIFGIALQVKKNSPKKPYKKMPYVCFGSTGHVVHFFENGLVEVHTAKHKLIVHPKQLRTLTKGIKNEPRKI